MKYWPIFIHIIACSSDKGITNFNSSPEIIITSHETGDELYIGDEVLFRAIASDPNHTSDNLNTKWFVDSVEICGTSEVEIDGSTTCNHVITETTNRIMVEVQDPTNAAGSDFIDITPIQPNSPPTCEINAPAENDSFRTTETVVFVGTLFDADQTPDSLSVEWLLDGTFLTSSTPEPSGLVIMESSFESGEHLVTLSVTDNHGDVCTAQLGIKITEPLEVTILPDPATTSDELFAFASGGSGINGLPPEYSFTWFQNTVESTLVVDSVPASSTSKGDIWRVEIKDSSGNQEVAFDEIIITNTLPQIDSLTIAPTIAYTNDVVQAQSSYFDSDGDSVNLNYEWFVDGSMVYDGGDTLDGSIYFDKNQEIYVLATPNDGDGFGISQTSTPISVLNTPPEAPILSISPLSTTI